MTRALTPLALVMLTLLGGCSKEEPAPAPVIRPVLSMRVEPRPVTAESFIGTVQPRYSRDLGFRVLGRIVARNVEVGQSVEAGQLLASLDPTALTLSVRSLEADLAKAEAQLSNAGATRDRQEALLAQRVGSQATLDTADEAAATAAATLTRAQASLDKAREQLSYTRLLSETEGVVTAVDAEIGQTVTAGQTVFTVAQASVREAVIDMPDAIAQRLAPGDPFEAILQVDPGVVAGGAVREVAPEADAATRTRRVRITLVDPLASFRIGTTLEVRARNGDASRLDLPASALLDAEGRHFVWVVDEAAGTVSRRAVEVEGAIGETARIASGLEVGQRVVTAGVHSLTEGQAVKLDGGIVP
ncbi:efflux RND transporter periplasmic adaptor subunit [Aureimonas pseudogalii]|uniref:RND family efflux transporter MFP subunit n=1 Tax=Aureimonas pseudogalii TaxID=1744844 RepID=A0A7W6H6N9_9HYPH|nr:efflux RND transporter periplasmic adaptor subunit [Aureimonas pseudogalii]MBB3999473.1 RND family efflux transporter MFP subunit [Aureimonas pseudogalii]